MPRVVAGLRFSKVVCASSLSWQSRGIVSKRWHIEPTIPHYASDLRRGDLLFVSEPLDMCCPLDQAISAVGKATVQWLSSRPGGAACAERDEVSEHVAMVITDARGRPTGVVEAMRVAGVRVLTLEDFIREFPRGSRFFHGRLHSVSNEMAAEAASHALRQVGAPYADNFASWTAAQGSSQPQFYCSSLVDYAYRTALRKDLVFTDVPFQLIFEPKDYWEDYYRRLGRPLPSGEGSNPTLLMHSLAVEFDPLDIAVSTPEESKCHEFF